MSALPTRSSHPLSAALLAVVLLAGAGCGQPEAPAVEGERASATLVQHVVSVLDPQYPEAPYEIDLERLPYGETARYTVHLRNDSGKPLVIRSVRPGCSCTTPVLSYVDPATGEQVRASARGSGDVMTVPADTAFDMELAVDSTVAPAKNKHKLVLVRMTTDSEVEPYITFNLRVFVESHFLPAPARIDLGDVSRYGGAQGRLTLVADSLDGHAIREIESCPRDLQAWLTDDVRLGPRMWHLDVQLLPPIALGPQSWTITLGTTGPDGEGQGTPVEVEVRAVGTADVVLEPAIVLLDPTPVGEAANNRARVVTRLAGQRLRVREARVEGDLAAAFTAEALPKAGDDDGASAEWTVRLVALAVPAEGVVSGTLVVELDDVEPARLEARMHYRP